MRIGINAAFWGMQATGSGQYLHHLTRALAQHGSEAELFLFAPRSAQPEEGPWRWETLPTPCDGLGDNLAKLWFEQVAYPRACHRRGVDLAHVPYFAPPLRPTAPTVVTIHDLIPLILPAYRGSVAVRAYMALVSRAARGAALILTDSRASARDIERRLAIPRERIRVIYLAADERYRPRPDVADRARALGLPPRYLLYLGGFDRRKNVVGLLRAYAAARERMADVALVIAGRLPERHSAFTPDPRVVAEPLDLGDSLHLTGWVDEADKPALYAGALAFVFPSEYEGFGLPVLEAISCGTPGIVVGGSSLEEVVGLGGIVVPPDDVASLAEAMVAVVNSPSLRGDLAAKALQHAQGFSWERTARETWQAYRDALNMPRGTR